MTAPLNTNSTTNTTAATTDTSLILLLVTLQQPELQLLVVQFKVVLQLLLRPLLNFYNYDCTSAVTTSVATTATNMVQQQLILDANASN